MYDQVKAAILQVMNKCPRCTNKTLKKKKKKRKENNCSISVVFTISKGTSLFYIVMNVE
jgi:hypothetical protein